VAKYTLATAPEFDNEKRNYGEPGEFHADESLVDEVVIYEDGFTDDEGFFSRRPSLIGGCGCCGSPFSLYPGRLAEMVRLANVGAELEARQNGTQH